MPSSFMPAKFILRLTLSTTKKVLIEIFGVGGGGSKLAQDEKQDLGRTGGGGW